MTRIKTAGHSPLRPNKASFFRKKFTQWTIGGHAPHWLRPWLHRLATIIVNQVGLD